MDTEIKTNAEMQNDQVQNDSNKPKKRKRRLGDRREGRRIRTLDGIHVAMPFIMETRADACNTFAEELNITVADEFVQNQLISGKEGFSMLHVILAAYVRTVSQKPYLNRFLSGQKQFARKNILVSMAVKEELTSHIFS